MYYTATEMIGNMQICLVQAVNSDVKTFAKFTGIKKNAVFPSNHFPGVLCTFHIHLRLYMCNSSGHRDENEKAFNL